MTTNAPVRVAVAIPSGASWMADFSLSLANLLLYVGQNRLPGASEQSLFMVNKRGSILPQLRQLLARDALARGATHILWLDSDMHFAPETLHSLMSHDLPVVGANCPTKAIPAMPTARQRDNTPGGKCVYTRLDSTGVERVWRLGFGIMLTEAKVFAQMPKPWFGIDWNEEFEDHFGEDWYFCRRCERADIPIHVDHEVSKRTGHIGQFTYTHDEVEIPSSIVLENAA